MFYENCGNGDSFYYFYDSYGKLSAIYHHRNGTKVAYHVLTNSQGDVIALYSWAGALVATYEYDAWGNCTIVSDTSSTGIATLNPMRYRGYYYDKDLGLYYLQSRYYDSEIGRFINADSFVTTGQGVTSYNMYAYCLNNPVNATDPSGHIAVLLGLVAAVSAFVSMATAALVIPAVVNHVVNQNNYKSTNTRTESNYTEDEAKEEINKVLNKYDAEVSYIENGEIGITNSKNVTSRMDRQYISSIISKTDGFEGSSASSLSAEWAAHNVGYYVTSVIPVSDYNEKCKDVDLAYIPDDRPVIKECTIFCEVFGWQ